VEPSCQQENKNKREKLAVVGYTGKKKKIGGWAEKGPKQFLSCAFNYYRTFLVV
jgi:hypothetical protein